MDEEDFEDYDDDDDYDDDEYDDDDDVAVNDIVKDGDVFAKGDQEEDADSDDSIDEDDPGDDLSDDQTETDVVAEIQEPNDVVLDEDEGDKDEDYMSESESELEDSEALAEVADEGGDLLQRDDLSHVEKHQDVSDQDETLEQQEEQPAELDRELEAAQDSEVETILKILPESGYEIEGNAVSRNAFNKRISERVEKLEREMSPDHDRHFRVESHPGRKNSREEPEHRNVGEKPFRHQLRRQKVDESDRKKDEMKKPETAKTKPEVTKPRPEEDPATQSHRARQQMLKEMRRLAEKDIPKKKSFADATCDLQLVETIPESLIRRGYAKRLPVEHISTYEVKSG